MSTDKPEVTSCGFLIVRQHHGAASSSTELLVMDHADRLDLPKGHVDAGETRHECALRELEEETGLPPEAIAIDPNFEFITHYPVRSRHDPDRWVTKELRLYLAWLKQPSAPIRITEHAGYHWQPWHPGLRLQPETWDPLLAQLDEYWSAGPLVPDSLA